MALLGVIRGCSCWSIVVACAALCPFLGCSLGFDDYRFADPDAGDGGADRAEGGSGKDGSGAGRSSAGAGAGGNGVSGSDGSAGRGEAGAGGSDGAGMDGGPVAGSDASMDAGPDAAACEDDQVRSDEGVCVDLLPCEVDNGGCEQRCVDRDGEAECSCKAGFRLEANEKDCRLAAFSTDPTELSYAALTPLALDMAPSGAGLLVVVDGSSLRSRSYTAINGWSAAFGTIPSTGASPGADNGRLVLLDSGLGIAVWHRPSQDTYQNFIYSAVFMDDTWTAPARRNVQNGDGAYAPELTWDGASRVSASWRTWDSMIKPHIWTEGYEVTQGWLGAVPVEAFVASDPNAPTSDESRVLGVDAGHTLVVIKRGGGSGLNLSYRRVDASAGTTVTAVPGNPHPGTTFSLVGNRHGTAFLVSGDASNCRARRYTASGGFAADTIGSATVATAACPIAVNRAGDGFALWVDGDGTLQSARLPAASVDATHPSGAWDAATPIAATANTNASAAALAVALETDDRIAVWRTLATPSALYASVYVEDQGWSSPRRLSIDNGKPVSDTFHLRTDASGNAIIVFLQPRNGTSPSLLATHLR